MTEHGPIDSRSVLAPSNSLEAEAEKLVERLAESLRSNTDASLILSSSEHCAYVKSADGQILFSNSNYDRTFGNGVSAVGRYARAFLDELIVKVSQESDSLILNGCSTIQIDHPGRDSDGRQVRLRTVKKSMLGMGHPLAAILGLTQVLHASADERVLKVLGLSRRWQLFQQLAERDRTIAMQLAEGSKSRPIAMHFSVTEKTIDNRRSHILKHLSLKNTMELARLLCRLQDNGFCDFGL